MPLSNYPAGVTGREYQIAGADAESDTIVVCTSCGNEVEATVSVYAGSAWLDASCETCGNEWTEDIDASDFYEGPDNEGTDDA